MAIINDKNGIKSKISSIIGNNEDDEKQKIRNKINSILNTSKGVDMTENKEKKSSLGSDFIGLVSNATRSVVNLGTNAFQNLGRRTEQTFEDREKMGQELNEEITKKRLEKQGYTEAQIQEYIDNIPTLKDYASKHNTLNKISETVNNVLSPLSKTNLQKIENTNNQKIQENITNASNPVSKKILELTPSVAQSAVNLIPGGSLVFASGITQSYYEEAKEQRGMTDEEADKYASIMAGLETVSEMIGASLAKKVGSALFKGNVKSAFKNIGLEIGENFLEEAVMEPMGELTTTVVAGKEKANWDNIGERTLKAGIDGALASILLGGASAGVGSAGNLINKLSEGKTVTQNELKGTLEDVQKSQKVEVEAIFKNEMKKALELEKGAFYTIKLDANGQVQGVEQTLGKEIDNPNKRVNISPVVIYNQTNESYNIIDKNTGILFDATPYESLIAAKIGFNKKMANLDSNTINSVNNKMEKASYALQGNVEELKAYAESVINADEIIEKVNQKNNSSIKTYTQEDIKRFSTGKYNLIDGYNGNLLDFIKEHYDEETKNAKKHMPREKEKKMFLGRINNTLSQKLSNLINNSKRFEKKYDLTNYNIVITENNIEHVFNKHGNEKEVGQIDVTPENLEKYRDVASAPDYIGLSDNSLRGNPVIYLAKKINGYSVAVEIITKNKQMYPNSYYIFESDSKKWREFIKNRKLKEVEVVDSNESINSHEMNAQGDTTVTSNINNSITQKKESVKGTTVNNKDMQKKQNDVKKKVEKYLKEIESDMTVDEFISKFKDMEITNAENLSSDKKRLYDLIMEVKESNSAIIKEEQSQYLEKVLKMEYNDNGIVLTSQEYKGIESTLRTYGRIRNVGKQDVFWRNHYYIIDVDTNEKIKVILKIEIEGNEERIGKIRKEFSNGAFRDGKRNNSQTKRNEFHRTTGNNNNVMRKNSKATKGNDESVTRSKTKQSRDIRGSSENKSNVKNSNKSSFSNVNEEQYIYNYKEQEEANQQTDNKGRKLTKEQQEKFKNSKARDTKGNLVTVYHGTKNEFYEFTDKYMGKGQWNTLGEGYYFTSDEREAAYYSKIANVGEKARVLEVYLNIENPVVLSEIDENTFANKIDEMVQIINPSIDINDEFYKNYTKPYIERKFETPLGFVDYIKGIAQQRGIKASEIYKALGYDGIIDGNQYVVFDSNQIKSIENLNPTRDKNIFKEDEEAYKYVQNELKANKRDNGIKIENGKVIYRKFKQDFIDKGYTDLNNTKIEGREDLADIAQIFRNPKYETFRIIYMKGDTIVGHEAISSKIPNASTMLKTDKHGKTHNAKEYYRINDRMKRLEADGYYMVHNHPTGNAKASKDDIASTNIFRKNVNGFKGHLILNSGTYAWISEKYVENELKIKDYKQDKIDKMMNANPIIDNIQLNDVIEITHLIDHIKNTDNYSILIYADNKLKTRMIQEVHNSFFNMQDKQTIGYLRNQARKNGASKVFFATSNEEAYNKSEKLTRADVLMDSVLYKWNSLNGFNVPIIESMRSNKKIEYKGDGLFKKVEGMRTNETIDEVYEMVQKTTKQRKQNNANVRQAKKEGQLDDGKTNAERASAYIEQEIQKIEKTGRWDESISVTRLTDIRKTIEDYLGIGIKKGRFRQRAYGIYKTNRDIIRTKEYKDIDTILHETGHALDIGKRIKINKWDIADELLRAISKYGGYETESRRVKLEEGFAEVIREYGIIPEQTKKEYPQTVAVIEEIRKADKSFDKFIGTVQQQIYNYIHQTPANRVHSNQSIGEQTDKQPLTKEWIKQEVMRNVWDKDYEIKALVDALAKAGGKTTNQIKASQNAYLLTRLSNGVAQKSTSMLANGYIDESGNKLMPGLNQIGEILKNDPRRFNDLRDYLVAQRDLEYKAKTLKTGIRTMDSKTVVEQFKNDKEIQEAAKIVYDTLNGVLQYAVNNHLIRQEEADRLRKSNAFYVPMQRVIEGQGNQVGRRGAVTEIIKKRTGSELDVKDVLENIIANSTNIIQQVENNNALKALYKQGEAVGKTGGIYDVISAPMIKVGTAKLSTWEKELQEQGVNTNELDLEKTIDIFVPNNKIDTKNLITSFVNDNGKRVYLQFYDEIIFNSMMGMDKQFMSQVLKINRMANMPLRYGATMANVGFAIPNMISDTVQATIYSTAGFIPLIDNALGVIEILAANNKVAKQFLNKYVPNYVKKVNELYTIYQQTGAQSATRLSQYRKSAQEVMRDVYGTKQSENLGVKENIKPLKRLLDILTYIPELSEQSTRFKVFEKNYKYYKKKGYSEKDARLMAAVESRDATQDFSRTGNITKEINQIIPFSAARVGSAYTFSEKVKANPKQIAMRTSILIVLAMAIKAIGYNDKEIEELNQRKKDDNFVLKIGDAVVTIKKPQGVLRSMINLAEYIQDLFTGHIDEGKEGERLGEWISSAIMDNMPTDEITGWVPNAVAPLIENAINKDFYYNTEIVKSYDLDLPDEQQYYDYNSQLAIWLGDVFNYPPAKIDNLISGYFGGLGTGLTDKMDWMIGKLGLTAEKPEMGAEDSMIGKRFVVNVNSHSASIDEIYNRRTELNKKKNGGTITDAETAELETITSAISNLSKLNKQIREIKADTSLSGEEKAKQIKVLQQEKTDTARKALDKELIYEENEQKIESTQFYPTNTELKNSGYVLTLTSKMKKEYEEYANKEYNRLKKQGLYTEEKMIESAKKKAKAYMFSTYRNKLVKAET